MGYWGYVQAHLGDDDLVTRGPTPAISSRRAITNGEEVSASVLPRTSPGGLVAWVDGVYEELWMFCLRLSGSGRAFHEAFANEAIESFLDGHVHAFEYFYGVPAGYMTLCR